MKKKIFTLICTIFVLLVMAGLYKLPTYASSLNSPSDVSEVSDVSTGEGTEFSGPREVNLYFELCGGNFGEGTYVPETFVTGDSIEIPTDVYKQGYVFGGWFTSKARIHEITDLNEATILEDVTGERGSYISLYANWIVPETFTPKIEKVSNPIKGVIVVGFADFDKEADGFEIQYANNSDYSEKVRYKDVKNPNILTFIRNKVGPQTYYLRVRSYKFDSVGERVYSKFSPTRVLYLRNGSDEIEPTPNNGTIKSARIEGGNVVVSAEIPERTAGYDDNYYIVKIDPIYDTIIGPLTSCDKDDEITASFPVGGNLMAKLAVAVKESEDSYTLISPGYFIDNPEALAGYTAAYPRPASKKGRQGAYSVEMGDKHFFHNLYIEELIGTPSSYDVAYNYNGRTYYFYTPTHHIDYNSFIRAANANGGTATIQLMIRWGGNATDMICPTGRTPGYNYYAFNMEEAGGREKVEACFMFLAEYWSKSNLHVDNWILGNEVNTYLNTTGRWYWAGNISRDSFMTNYSNTFRCLYYAVKSHYANAHVFTCTDHTWNDRDRDWGTKGFITALNSYLAAMNPNIQWNLANHAYTAVLTNADPWNDGAVRIYSVAHSTGASFVSPYNLEVLTNYVSSNFGPNVRIILSEVGFSYTNGTNPTLNGGRQQGTDVQAAATAYLYYKAHFTSNIDACIFHTGDEGEPGKNFRIEGLPAGDVYTYMDTPSYAEHTNQYLGLIGGASSWEQIIPGFNSAALQGMPSR